MSARHSSDVPIYFALQEFARLWPSIFDYRNPLYRLITARSVNLLGESLKRSKQINGKSCDLLAKGKRPDGDGTLVDLLTAARNASAHVFSGQRKLTGEIVVSGIADHHARNAVVVDGVPYDVGFDGDFTIYWGGIQVTTNGDLLPAYDWLRAEYGPGLDGLRPFQS